MSKDLGPKKQTKVITIRIDKELNENLDKCICPWKFCIGLQEKNYLELSEYFLKHKSTIQSLNDRDLVIIKRSFLRNLIERLDEKDQIKFGDKLGRFINDIARIYGKQEDLQYKIDFCDNLGFFNNLLDESNYLLIEKKFGPIKFAEAFLWRLFEQKELNPNYIEEEMKGNKSLRQKYKNQIKNLVISSSHYSYEFARIDKEKKD